MGYPYYTAADFCDCEVEYEPVKESLLGNILVTDTLENANNLAYLLKYDTNHGNYKLDDITYDDEHIYVGEKKIKIYRYKQGEKYLC